MEHLKGDSLGQAPPFLTNITLGWKGLPGKNAVAYYSNSKLTTVKFFITLATGGSKVLRYVSLLLLSENWKIVKNSTTSEFSQRKN
jgi:hypothetical protein